MVMSINTRSKNKYRGFTLKPGYVYGRDNTSPFVTARMRDRGGADGINATVMLWRLDMDSTRGWYVIWECSDTTRMIVTKYGRTYPNSVPTHGIERYGCGNALTEVRRCRGGDKRVFV